MISKRDSNVAYHFLLRAIPPPRLWRRLLALVPQPLLEQAVERTAALGLGSSAALPALEPIQQRRIGIEVSDLDLSWVVELHDGRLRISHQPAEVTVCGSAADLLLLAGRLEDADTLFFQRKLTLTGDTELGVTVRNLLDRLPWGAIPLGPRIILHRTGRLLRAARAAHHGEI